MYDGLFKALFEIVTFLNRPKQDKVLLKKAGIELDTALLPIVVRVGVQKKLGIVELADQLGRDHSTVSRQVDRLQVLGLVETGAAKSDGRVRDIRLSSAGKVALAKVVKARRVLMREALADWNDTEIGALSGSLQHLARTLKKLGV